MTEGSRTTVRLLRQRALDDAAPASRLTGRSTMKGKKGNQGNADHGANRKGQGSQGGQGKQEDRAGGDSAALGGQTKQGGGMAGKSGGAKREAERSQGGSRQG